jgi:hypothetical protein
MLEGQGDILTAQLEFTGKYDFTTGKAFVLVVATAEDIT